jgi:flagellar hook protein FlgE
MSYETSLSGIRAALIRLHVSANDVANAQTEGHTDHRVVAKARPGGGVDASIERTDQPVSIEGELAEQIVAANTLKVNAAVLRAESDMEDSLIDLLA